MPKRAGRNAGIRYSEAFETAVVKDLAWVALQAANSPQMIFSNYRELVTRQPAKEWFGSRP
jgi:hypothetical protein